MTRKEKQKAINVLKISAPIKALTREEFNDYIQTLNKVMDWLEQKPCEDAISRKAHNLCDVNKAEFVKKLENETIGLQSWQKALVYQIMDDCHSETSQEPKIGHWIQEKTIHGWDGYSYQCSVCGRSIHLDTLMEDLTDYPYCHCGAKMVEPQESEDNTE